jgi:hypothetical protein
MTHEERELLNSRIAYLLYWGLVVIRNYTHGKQLAETDRTEEMNDLADLLHNLPRYITGDDQHAIQSAEQLRSAVVQHVKRFYPEINPNTHRYVQVLDVDEATFRTTYSPHDGVWPELSAVR